MQIKIVHAGKTALKYACSGIENYQKRLTRYGSYEIKTVKAGDSLEVSNRLLEASKGSYRIALDERGKALTTRELSKKFEQLEMNGNIKSVAFLIGASDGHTNDLRQNCDFVLNLSTLTLQHELALLVLMEQLYRIASIKSGSPYHRD